jgi:hypothetical protein
MSITREDYEKYLNDMMRVTIKKLPDHMKYKPDNTKDNSNMLLDIIKDKYCISDEQMKELTPSELKQLIREYKLKDLL